MRRELHFRLYDIGLGKGHEHRVQTHIAPDGIIIEAKFPGEEIPRAVWVEIKDGNMVVRAYNPAHEEPVTLTVTADSTIAGD